MLEPPEPIRADELDIIGEIFGIRFTDGCSTGCVELYGEDDGFWHLQMTFDRLWLADLGRVVSLAHSQTSKEKADE